MVKIILQITLVTVFFLSNILFVNNLLANEKTKSAESKTGTTDHSKTDSLDLNFIKSDIHSISPALNLEAVYTGETFYTKSSYKNRIGYLDNLYLGLVADLGKTLGLNGFNFFISVLSNYGNEPNEFVGSAHGTSNIETINSIRVYQTYLEKTFLNTNLSILLGLYDLNSEFDTRESSSLFLNPSHGIGLDFAQSGMNGPSIFPNLSLALRVKYKSESPLYLIAAVLDGVPGNIDSPEKTTVHFGENDGYLLSAETGLLNEDESGTNSKISLGIWHYTGKFVDLIEFNHNGNLQEHRNNFGVYGFFEKKLFDNTTIFARAGFANSDINMIKSYFASGITSQSIFLPADALGLAFATAQFSDKFKKAENYVDLNSDMNLEVTYSFNVLERLRIQPNLQYFINPAFNAEQQNVTVYGIRFESTLSKALF